LIVLSKRLTTVTHLQSILAKRQAKVAFAVIEIYKCCYPTSKAQRLKATKSSPGDFQLSLRCKTILKMLGTKASTRLAVFRLAAYAIPESISVHQR
jgi:hypothetical protein